MSSKINLIELLQEEGCCSPEEKEVITYGIEQGRNLILSITATLLLGTIFKVPVAAIIFLATFIPLRMYAGGYHADTQLRCSILSVGIIAISFWALSNVQWDVLGSTLLCVIGFAIIFFMAPVENDKKCLEEIERCVYRKRTRHILILESIILLFSLYFEQKMLFSAITISFLLASILLVMGNVKYHKTRR